MEQYRVDAWKRHCETKEYTYNGLKFYLSLSSIAYFDLMTNKISLDELKLYIFESLIKGRCDLQFLMKKDWKKKIRFTIKRLHKNGYLIERTD